MGGIIMKEKVPKIILKKRTEQYNDCNYGRRKEDYPRAVSRGAYRSHHEAGFQASSLLHDRGQEADEASAQTA